MTYQEYERKIEEIVTNASAEARRRFAMDSMLVLRRSAEDAVNDELNAHERVLLSTLLCVIESASPEILANALTELAESKSADPIRAIEMSPGLAELLCAIDNWIEYRRSSDPQKIARLAVNVVNIVDYATGGERGAYSPTNFLGEPRMSREFERQRRLLSSA